VRACSCVYTPISMLIMGYALWTYEWRSSFMRKKQVRVVGAARGVQGGGKALILRARWQGLANERCRICTRTTNSRAPSALPMASLQF
jgi:hypothetical protein